MKEVRALTDYVVKTLKATRGQTGWKEYPDGGCRGLLLKVSPRGEKAWAIRIKINGKRTYRTIGGYPAVTLAEARKRVSDYMAAARDGLSPDSLEAKKRAASMTVAEAHATYLETVGTGLRSRTLTNKQTMFRDHIGPVAGNRLIQKIRRADVIEVVESVRRKGFGVQSNRVFSEFMALLRWCEAREWIDGVPAIQHKTIGQKERKRDRTLTDNEIAELWYMTENFGDLSGPFIRLLLLTGQRRDDVRLMRWEEIDMDSMTWIIPAERYKTAVDHVVPLSTSVMDILRERWVDVATGYVLEGRNEGQPFAGQASAMRRLRSKIKADYTLHDLRRTCRTRLSRLGVDSTTAEAVLGHAPSGIEQVYDRYDRLDEKRNALQRWSDFIASVTGERGENVVPLKSA